MMRVAGFFIVGLGIAVSAVAQEEASAPRIEAAPDTEQGLTLEQQFRPGDVTDIVKQKRVKLDDVSVVPSDQVARSKVSFLVSTGLEYTDEGEFEAAEQAYLRALEQEPGNDDILFRLSTLYVLMERYESAIEMLEKQLVRYPENPLLNNNLSWCYAASQTCRNTEKALRHAREAILTSPNNSSMWNTLAEAYYVAADYDRALRSAEYAIDLLAETNPSAEEMAAFTAQRAKILRAQEAFKLIEGLDAE